MLLHMNLSRRRVSSVSMLAQRPQCYRIRGERTNDRQQHAADRKRLNHVPTAQEKLPLNSPVNRCGCSSSSMPWGGILSGRPSTKAPTAYEAMMVGTSVRNGLLTNVPA